MNSFRFAAGTDGWITIRRSEELMPVIGAKSRIRSNGFFGISVSFTVCVFDITSSV